MSSNEVPDDEDLLEAVRLNPGITTSELHAKFPQMGRQTIYNRMRRFRKHWLVRDVSSPDLKVHWYEDDGKP